MLPKLLTINQSYLAPESPKASAEHFSFVWPLVIVSRLCILLICFKPICLLHSPLPPKLHQSSPLPLLSTPACSPRLAPQGTQDNSAMPLSRCLSWALTQHLRLAVSHQCQCPFLLHKSTHICIFLCIVPQKSITEFLSHSPLCSLIPAATWSKYLFHSYHWTSSTYL